MHKFTYQFKVFVNGRLTVRRVTLKRDSTAMEAGLDAALMVLRTRYPAIRVQGVCIL